LGNFQDANGGSYGGCAKALIF